MVGRVLEKLAEWADIQSSLLASTGACLALKDGRPAVVGTKEYAYGT